MYPDCRTESEYQKRVQKEYTCAYARDKKGGKKKKAVATTQRVFQPMEVRHEMV